MLQVFRASEVGIMSDLDDRLIDILQHTTQAESIALQMAQIKQAFADEWLPKIADVYANDPEHKKSLIEAFREAGYMTGQEWYDRFEAELAAIPGDEAFTTVEILAAARKAAGL